MTYEQALGHIIKDRRESLGATQTDLCRGICSISTLSRAEGGEYSDSRTISIMLDKLGLSDSTLTELTRDPDYAVRQKIREANQADCLGEKAKARAIMDELSCDYDDFSLTNKQRYDTLDTLLMYDDGIIDDKTRLKNLEKCLRMTLNNYSSSSPLPKVLTRSERDLLEHIANSYYYLNNRPKAIEILYQVKEYVEAKILDKLDAAEDLSFTCYNLSKFLGLEGRYDECIDVARRGIYCSRYSSQLDYYARCMYNCAWSMARRNEGSDREEAKALAEKALALASVEELNLQSLKGHIENFLKEFYG
ncbi:MAG: helix-turn-helix domain-containing protein [Firmicutes bacterium]|nr:helix-turn-helix domain-containing protein [Bacillota bacterium]